MFLLCRVVPKSLNLDSQTLVLTARSLADSPQFPLTCAQVRNGTIYLKLT